MRSFSRLISPVQIEKLKAHTESLAASTKDLNERCATCPTATRIVDLVPD